MCVKKSMGCELTNVDWNLSVITQLLEISHNKVLDTKFIQNLPVLTLPEFFQLLGI